MNVHTIWQTLTSPELLDWAYTILWFVLLNYAAFRLLSQRREPAATFSWLLIIIILPIAGPFLFFLIGPQRIERRASKRKSRLKGLEIVPQLAAPIPGPQFGQSEEQVLQLAQQLSEYRLSSGNSIELLPEPAKTLEAMHRAIDEAKNFVHLEYYIIASDEVTEQLFKSLERAMGRGVEVRILYDAFGSLTLKRRYFEPLIKKGAKVAGFLPFSLSPQRLYPNFRNHRKILVVDGLVAFTGGTNIGKEYLGRKTSKSWRDFSVRVTGPVVLQLQDVFAKDWHFTTEEDLFKDFYYPQAQLKGDSFIQVMESGPDSSFPSLHNAIFLAINSAEKLVHLTTPYFIPDGAMMSALTVAAMRGVDVQILLPAKNDLPVVRAASRSFYEPLLEAGAKIFEYQPTILHSKLLNIDNRLTMVGSANMDIRSFRLNFELNLFVEGTTFAVQAEQLFQTDIKQSKAIELEQFRSRPVLDKIVENTCRLFSPIL